MDNQKREFHKEYITMLEKTNYPELFPKKWDKFIHCCAEQKIVMKPCECGCNVEIFFNRCKLQFCPLCGNIQSIKKYKEALLISRILQHEQPENKPISLFFFTFTIKTGANLDKQIKKILAALRKMKKHNAWWDTFCLAGFQSIEITESKGKWHVHCHMLILTESNWIQSKDLNKLKQYWLKITGDSFVINAKKIKNIDDCKDVFKYALKHESITRKGLYEFAVKTTRKRLYSKIGKAYNHGKKQSDILKKKMLKRIEEIYKTKVSEGDHICPDCQRPAEWEVFQPKPTYNQIKRKFTGKTREYTVLEGEDKFLSKDEKVLLDSHFLPESTTQAIMASKKISKDSIQESYDQIKHIILEDDM